ERDQQPGTSRTEPMPGLGAARLFAICGLWGDELQPARDRAGVAGAGMGAGQAGAVGGLKAPHLKPQAKSDRGGCRYRRRSLTVWAWLRLKSAVRYSTAALNVSRRFRNDEFSAR